MSHIHISSDIVNVIKRGDSEKYNIPICLIFYLIENIGLDCYDLIIRFLKPKFLVVLDIELHLDFDNIDIVTELEFISLCHESISEFRDVISNISETCIFSNLNVFLSMFFCKKISVSILVLCSKHSPYRDCLGPHTLY